MKPDVERLVPSILVSYAVTGNDGTLMKNLSDNSEAIREDPDAAVRGCSLAREAARAITGKWLLVQKRLSRGIEAVFGTIGIAVNEGIKRLDKMAEDTRKKIKGLLTTTAIPLFLATLVVIGGASPIYAGNGPGSNQLSIISTINDLQNAIKFINNVQRYPEDTVLRVVENMQSNPAPDTSSWAAADAYRIMTGKQPSDSDVKAAWKKAGKPSDRGNLSSSTYVVRSVIGALGMNVEVKTLFTNGSELGKADLGMEKKIAEVISSGGIVVCFSQVEGNRDTISAMGSLAYDVLDNTSKVRNSRRLANVLAGKNDSLTYLVVENIGVVKDDNEYGIPAGVMVKVSGRDKKAYLASAEDLGKVVDYAITIKDRSR